MLSSQTWSWEKKYNKNGSGQHNILNHAVLVSLVKPTPPSGSNKTEILKNTKEDVSFSLSQDICTDAEDDDNLNPDLQVFDEETPLKKTLNVRFANTLIDQTQESQCGREMTSLSAKIDYMMSDALPESIGMTRDDMMSEEVKENVPFVVKSMVCGQVWFRFLSLKNQLLCTKGKESCFMWSFYKKV